MGDNVDLIHRREMQWLAWIRIEGSYRCFEDQFEPALGVCESFRLAGRCLIKHCPGICRRKDAPDGCGSVVYLEEGRDGPAPGPPPEKVSGWRVAS